MTPAALVIVTTSYPETGDGREAAGSFVADLAEELSKHIPVRVVAPGVGNTVECVPTTPDLQVYRYAAPAKPLSTLKPWQLRDARDALAVLRSGAAATERAVAAGNTAHILALWALPSGAWARRAARRHGIGYSVWTLGSDIWSLGRVPILRQYLASVLKHATTCYSDGLKLAEDTRRICGRNVEFMPSTRRIVRTRDAPLRTNPPYRLLFLGRWHPNKGVDLLLDALGLLQDEDWQRIEVVRIFGGGPMEAEVHAGVARLRSIGRAVEMGGYLDKPAAEQAMLDADYVLIPSRIESIPVVFSDAMKLMCPVAAMPVGDLPGLIESDKCGACATDTSSLAFARTISQMLYTDPAGFAEGLGRVAHRFDMRAGVVDRILPLAASRKDVDGGNP